MENIRKYPHPKLRNEYIELRWKKGYSKTEVWFHGELIKEITGVSALLKKVRFSHDQLGEVEIYLAKDPYVLNLKVDRFHSSLNSEHPSKRIKNVSNWLIPGLLIHFIAATGMLYNYFTVETLTREDQFLPFYHTFFFLCFLVSISMVRLKHYWFFLIGVFGYSAQLVWLMYLVYLQGGGRIETMIFTFIYLIFSMMIFSPTKRVFEFQKHQKYTFVSEEEILDN